jgi:hypothetical protein
MGKKRDCAQPGNTGNLSEPIGNTVQDDSGANGLEAVRAEAFAFLACELDSRALLK